MPLVRYEVRCEHSLANPELYRTAIQDDSEGLLEGVAMAGLVGLVRQLGDLAEFAAEIFHDLHDDIVKIVSRGQNVQSRVTRLEADQPVVEKALLAKASQFRFAYTARSKWRAPLPMDQNLCAHGELPRFVRNFYDDCRGPPRLFLLDKFDGDGRGACEKRYTDPTFFKLTWATSQLEKAEQLERERQEQLDLQAEHEKKSSMRKTSKYVYPRERLSSAHFENLEGFTGDFTPELRSMRLGQVPESGDLTPDEPQSPEGTQSKRQQRPFVDQGPALAPLKIGAKDIESAKRGRRMSPTTSDEEEEEASEYVDAVTAMPSDVNPEHNRLSAQKSADSQHETLNHKSVSLKHSPLKSLNEVQHQSPSLEQDQQDEFAGRLDSKISSSTAIELEREPGDLESHKNVASDEVLLNGHAMIPKLSEPAYDSESVVDVFSSRGEDPGVPVAARDLSKDAAPQATPEEIITTANVEQLVTTPRGRRQWARDNGSSSSIILSMVDVDLKEDLDFRARSVNNTGALSSVGEEQRRSGHELSHRSSSNASSPYTNISSSEEDGFTSESASSSPKRGANFCSLLSPPDSPPQRLTGSGNARSGRSSPRAPPPITPFLSSSPSVSRSSSKKHDSISTEKLPQNNLEQARPSPLVPRRSSLFPRTSDFAVANSAESSEKIKEILVTEPRSTRENGGLEPSRSQDQTSIPPNPVARARTWVDRSESNVAATLQAIRQAAAVGSDDDTGSEHQSDRW